MMLTPEWLVEALIGATLLMLLVLAVRKPVARLWGAHMAYALWALPALRMVLPAIPGWQPLYVPVAQSNPEGDVALALMPPADAALYNQPLPPATLRVPAPPAPSQPAPSPSRPVTSAVPSSSTLAPTS
jgi:hypothetical protein